MNIIFWIGVIVFIICLIGWMYSFICLKANTFYQLQCMQLFQIGVTIGAALCAIGNLIYKAAPK